MKPRALAVLFVIVAGLAAFVWFVERDLPGSDERAERAKRVFDLAEDEVTRLAWEREGERVELRREPGDDAIWRLTEPIAARADGAAVDALVAALLALEKERTIDDGVAEQMGLAPPRATVEIGSEESTRRLLIGGDVPASDSTVVAPAAEGPFHVVAGGVWDDLEKPAGDWRSRDVFGGERDEITGIVLDGPGGRVELEKRGEEFWIAAPLADRADAGTVNRFLDALTGLRVERFVDDLDAAPESAHGLEAASVVEVASGDATWRLELGAAAPGDPNSAAAAVEGDGGDARYARAEDRVFTVGTALDPALARPAEEWRSLEWARRQVFEIDAVEVRDAAGELSLAREAGEWTVGGAAVDFNAVSDLLYAVTGTKAEALDAVAAGEPLLSITLDPGEDAQRLEVFAAVGDRHPATASDRDTALWLGGDRVRDLVARVTALRAAAEAATAPAADAGDDGGDAAEAADEEADEDADDASPR